MKDGTFVITSPGPHPGSPNATADIIPSWAQQILSVLIGIKDDINNIRNDVLELQNRLLSNTNTNSDLFPKVHPSSAEPKQRTSMEWDSPEPPKDDSEYTQVPSPPHISFLHDRFQGSIGLQPT